MAISKSGRKERQLRRPEGFSLSGANITMSHRRSDAPVGVMVGCNAVRPFASMKSNVTGGDVAAAVLQRNAIATMVNVVRVIATVHIISSLLCGE